MRKNRLHRTNDFIIIESDKYYVALMGFAILLTPKSNENKLSNSISNFLDKINQSHVIRFNNKIMQVIFFFKEKKVEKIIDNVINLKEKIERINSNNSKFILSLLNHKMVTFKTLELMSEKINKTKNKMIIKVGKQYKAIFTILMETKEKPEITELFYNFSKIIACNVHLGTLVDLNKNKGEKKKSKILITRDFKSLNEAEKFISHLKLMIEQFQGKFSCKLRFFSHNECKKKKFSFALGYNPYGRGIVDYSFDLDLRRFAPMVKRGEESLIDQRFKDKRNKDREESFPIDEIQKNTCKEIEYDLNGYFGTKNVKFNNSINEESLTASENSKSKKQSLKTKKTNKDKLLKKEKDKKKKFNEYMGYAEEQEINKLIKTIPEVQK